MTAWYSRQERAARVLLVALLLLVPLLVGVAVTERQQRIVHSPIECAPVATDRLGKCPPGDDREVLTLVVPTGRGDAYWRVQSWSERTGWDALYGLDGYRVSTWSELPGVEQ